MTSRGIIHSIFLIFAMLLCGTYTSPARAELAIFPFVAQVVGGQVNVRAGQSANFERVCQLEKGDEILVLEKQFGWYKVQLPASARVYVSKQYVQYLGQNAGGVIADDVNIRAGAGIHYTVLGQLNKGEQVYLEEDLEDWYRIRPVSNNYGWVVEEYLAFKSSDTSKYATAANVLPEVVMDFKKESDEGILSVGGQGREKTFDGIPKESQAQDKKAVKIIKDISAEDASMDDVFAQKNSSPEAAADLGVKEFPKLKKAKEIPKAVVGPDVGKLPDLVTSKATPKAAVNPDVKEPPKLEKANEITKVVVGSDVDELPIFVKAKAIPEKKVPKFEVPENGILSIVGFVEPYEQEGDDGIYYVLILEGEPVCYVQGPNEMLGRFLHQKVTVNGTVNQEFLTKYDHPVMAVSKIRLMI